MIDEMQGMTAEDTPVAPAMTHEEAVAVLALLRGEDADPLLTTSAAGKIEKAIETTAETFEKMQKMFRSEEGRAAFLEIARSMERLGRET